MPNQEYLSYNEAAEKLGVSRRSVEDWVRCGKLGKKFNHPYAITQQDIEDFEPPAKGRPRKEVAQ